MQDENKLARLRYQCRRGMLELDAILQPFLEKKFTQLNPAQQQTFEHLLSYPDQQLYFWFIEYDEPEDQDLKDLITLIKEFKFSTFL